MSANLRAPFIQQGGVSTIIKLLQVPDATLAGSLLRALALLLLEGQIRFYFLPSHFVLSCTPILTLCFFCNPADRDSTQEVIRGSMEALLELCCHDHQGIAELAIRTVAAMSDSGLMMGAWILAMTSTLDSFVG